MKGIIHIANSGNLTSGFNSSKYNSRFSCYHIYQRSVDREKIFCSSMDVLVFLTILKMIAKRFSVDVYALCIMLNHTHLLVKAADEKTLSYFVHGYTSLFSRLYNKAHKRSGALFSTPYGRSWKYSDKYIRSSIAYIFNNPVEASICKKAEEYVWNLLAFRDSNHPFSERLDISQSRSCVRQTVKEIKAAYSRNEYLNYTVLRHLFKGTSEKEALQIRDLILNTYNPINYDALSILFGDMKHAIIAINSNTGAEYDIAEDDYIKRLLPKGDSSSHRIPTNSPASKIP